jgi:hypothetical protein
MRWKGKMKTKIIVMLLASAITAYSQTWFAGGSPISNYLLQIKNPVEYKILTLSNDVFQASNAWQQCLAQNSGRTNIQAQESELLNQSQSKLNDPWREIVGTPVFIQTDERRVGYSGIIQQTTSDGILIKNDWSDENIFIKNYPYTYADGTRIDVDGIPISPVSYTSILGAQITVNAIDYGRPCNPPDDAKKIESAYIKNNALIAGMKINESEESFEQAKQSLRDYLQQLQDAKQAVLDAKQKKKQAILDKALQYDETLASKGDDFGLLRMGERYRDGEGIQKDREKAIDYLSRAVMAGSPAASNELSQLILKE